MYKKKLLIHEVFNKAKKDFPTKGTKSGWSSELSDYFEKTWRFLINERTFVRYYNASIRDNKEPDIKDKEILDKLSQYIGYKDFADFSNTFIKKDEETNKTTIKISVDKDEESLSEKLSNIIINITNEQHFKMPKFIKQNGLGIMEIMLLISLVAGNVVFSDNKKITPLGFMSSSSLQSVKECMYWDGSEYRLADCKDKNPHLDLKPVDTIQMKYFKRITRKDTLTELNALGKTWYSKYNGQVEFFTNDGTDPNNGRELRKSTPIIIFKYAGKQMDSIEVQE